MVVRTTGEQSVSGQLAKSLDKVAYFVCPALWHLMAGGPVLVLQEYVRILTFDLLFCLTD